MHGALFLGFINTIHSTDPANPEGGPSITAPVRRKLSWKGAFMVTREQKAKSKMQMNLFTKQTHRLQKTNLWYQRGKVGGGIKWTFGIDIYTLLYLK